MKQLAFDFAVLPPPTLDNFVSGRNAELKLRLRNLASRSGDERLLYLWGPPGSGRTHLLRAALARLEAAGSHVTYFASAPGETLPDSICEMDAVAVDDVERLNEDAQVAFFNVYNAFRDTGRTLLAAGNAAPMQLALRADVVTRLGWGLVYEVHCLSDPEKAQALAEHAALRGFALQPDLIEYLLTHVRRDMPALLATVEALDRYSLSAKRAVTMPLLRELLSSLKE
ncbi:MAG TPA: DnaA regulatory inactivator Hda [Burkholderiales bacterium]|nr:DnaA regulatory inactivator Hda [Burkholderiales bacterium]